MTQEQLLNIPLGESVDDGAWEILRVTGTTISFAGDNDYYDNAKESYDEVMAMIQAMEAVK